MKNKVIKVCLTLLLAFYLGFGEIFAIECEYESKLTVTFDDEGKAKINQDFFPDESYIWAVNWLIQNSSGNIENTDELDSQPLELKGFCPGAIYACKYEEYSTSTGLKNFFDSETSFLLHLRKVYLYYSEHEMEKNADFDDLPNDWNHWEESTELSDIINEFFDACDFGVPVIGDVAGGVCAIGGFFWSGIKAPWANKRWYTSRRYCDTYTYQGDAPTYNLACKYITIYYQNYVNAMTTYKACSKTDATCIADAVSNANSQEEAVRNYCASLLKNYNYDNGNEGSCIEACLKISDTISSLKKEYGLVDDTKSACGLSGRVIIWIANIVRWAKYIVPIFVIILGIIDFIKAVASDKDDEMKKAQKRFIIRLVSAALIFIIPFIIEFVLDKMGFVVEGCGIIDL